MSLPHFVYIFPIYFLSDFFLFVLLSLSLSLSLYLSIYLSIYISPS